MSDDHEKSGNAGRWGTIFLGPTADRESTIDKVADLHQRELWNRRTEAEYMARVRARATLRVESMLEQARSNARVIRSSAEQWAEQVKARCQVLYDEARREREAAEEVRKEAEKQREAAYDEGYQRGVEQAMLELEEHRAGLDMTTAMVLRAVQAQCAGVTASWRAELAALLREAVEKSVGWVLSEDRAAVLEGLLVESVQALENRQRITVRVHPEDQAAVRDVLGSARQRFADLQSWDIVPDPELTPGGLIVESSSGRVDAGVEVRREAVEQVLRHLTLPRSEADETAEAAVAARAEDAGLPRLIAGAEEEARRRAAQETAQAEAVPGEENTPDPLPGLKGTPESAETAQAVGPAETVKTAETALPPSPEAPVSEAQNEANEALVGEEPEAPADSAEQASPAPERA